MKIHIALSNNRKVKVPQGNSPVIFLAGPIRNAPKWHDEALKILFKNSYEKDIFVAAPIRKVDENILPFLEKDNLEYQTFDRQRAWELNYLYGAADNGCIIFWLPKEAKEKEFPDKLYAHITMMELGGWIAKKKADDSINLVIGTDGEFPEWVTIKFDIENETPNVPICYSLEDTIKTALKTIYG